MAPALYLGWATVTLLAPLHEQVPAHGAAQQPVRVWGIHQAGRVGLLHEHLQVGPAAMAEHPGELGAASGELSQERRGTLQGACSASPRQAGGPSYPMLAAMTQPPPSRSTGQ